MDHFYQFITRVYDDAQWGSIHQNVLYIIGEKDWYLKLYHC